MSMSIALTHSISSSDQTQSTIFVADSVRGLPLARSRSGHHVVDGSDTTSYSEEDEDEMEEEEEEGVLAVNDADIGSDSSGGDASGSDIAQRMMDMGFSQSHITVALTK